jgi:hypothetical protein
MLTKYLALPLLLLCCSGKMQEGDECLVLRGSNTCMPRVSLMSVRTRTAEFGDAAQGYRRLEVVLSNRACPATPKQTSRKGKVNGLDYQLSFDYRTKGSRLLYYTGLVNTHSSFPATCNMSDVPLFALHDAVGTKRTTGANRCESMIETVLLSKAVTGIDTLITYAIDQHTSDSPHLSRITFDTQFHVKQLV